MNIPMTTKQNNRSRTTRLTPRGIRLTPSRSRGRCRTAKTPVTTVALPANPPTPAFESSNGDALVLYLREIGQVKLLTPQEEIDLAKKVRRGDARAREHMIKANLRLVVK